MSTQTMEARQAEMSGPTRELFRYPDETPAESLDYWRWLVMSGLTCNPDGTYNLTTDYLRSGNGWDLTLAAPYYAQRYQQCLRYVLEEVGLL